LRSPEVRRRCLISSPLPDHADFVRCGPLERRDRWGGRTWPTFPTSSSRTKLGPGRGPKGVNVPSSSVYRPASAVFLVLTADEHEDCPRTVMGSSRRNDLSPMPLPKPWEKSFADRCPPLTYYRLGDCPDSSAALRKARWGEERRPVLDLPERRFRPVYESATTRSQPAFQPVPHALVLVGFVDVHHQEVRNRFGKLRPPPARPMWRMHHASPPLPPRFCVL